MNFNFLDKLPTGINIFGIHITFYAIIILCGALLALYLAAFEARKEGYSWDFFSTVFIIAFPSGIIGARIWYVIAEWNSGGFANDFLEIFRIWDGGLAIQGGAIGGILAGALTVKYLRKGADVLRSVDYAVPGILIGQAIGRWGNFFNFEVYGFEVSRNAWSFLPNFVLNQMQVTTSNPALINVPLFLVESIINICGYLIIMHFIIPLMKQKNVYHGGDGFCLYFAWYGIVRSILEPMRNSNFIMGNENVYASSIMAYCFIAIGIGLFILNRFLPKIIKSKKVEDRIAK